MAENTIKLAAAKARLKRRQAAYERSKAKHLPDIHKRLNRRDKTRRVVRALQKLRKAQHGSSKAHPPKVDVTLIGNHSSRGGVVPRLLVAHITVSHNRPGTGDVFDILHYFTTVDASAHKVLDFEGTVGHGVNDDDKAWTCAAFNAPSLNTEIISWADLASTDEWHKQAGPALENLAQLWAFWSVKYDIPLVHSTVRGCCEHRELGAAGGGHSDVGANFPLGWVMSRAQAIKASWS